MKKTGLKRNIKKNQDHGVQSHHFLANRRGRVEAVMGFISLAPKSLQLVTAAVKLKDACSLEGKLWHLDGVLKSRDITLSTKVCIVKAVIFPVVMYGCESWTIKNAEHQRTDAFALWCWWRFLRVPWTSRRSTQSILKEINPEYSLEELMLKWNSNTLATCCDERTHWKRPWCWER